MDQIPLVNLRMTGLPSGPRSSFPQKHEEFESESGRGAKLSKKVLSQRENGIKIRIFWRADFSKKFWAPNLAPECIFCQKHEEVFLWTKSRS